MYINTANVIVLDYDYEGKEKKNITSHEFNFNDGVRLKDLSRFLENLEDSHRFDGSVMVSVTIDNRERGQ